MPTSDGASLTIDDVLEQIRSRLNLESETEHEVLEEIRGHLEEAVTRARAAGQDEATALARAAARFGIDETAHALQATHAGRGTLNGIALAALPVLFTLALRWLIFAPDGTAGGWHEMLARPVLWVIVGAALLLPILSFPRRRYVLALWLIFWGLSLATTLFAAARW